MSTIPTGPKSASAFEDHTQWKAVKEVCQTLKEAGYEALLAGGCVRDLLMNRTPNDFDVATNATPDQVEALFERSITVGKAFGVTILPFKAIEAEGGDFQIEIATFREDLEYKDGRRPEGVKFSTAKADAQRRDFTVNALFYDPIQKTILDYVDGQKDIAAKLLRTVGKPELRFEEDKLRILRAIRFAAQLDFEIEEQTLKVVEALSSEVSVVSRERIRDELNKLLKSPNRVKGLRLLLSTGVLAAAFPEAASAIISEGPKWLKRFEVAGGAPSEFDEVFWLSLFLFPAFRGVSEKDFRDRQLKTLKIENQTAEQVLFVLKNLAVVLEPSKLRLGLLATLLTKPGAGSLLKIGQLFESLNEGSAEADRAALLSKALKAAHDESGEVAPAILSGKDLKEIGFKPGPEMGTVLTESYLLQLEGQFQTKSDAVAWAKSQFKT